MNLEGHVFEMCPNKGKNKVPTLNITQIYHLGQIDNYDDKKAARVKSMNVHQLAESFQGLKPTSGLNSPVMSPRSPNSTDQPPECKESADSAEEGELRPSPVVRRREMAAELEGGDP